MLTNQSDVAGLVEKYLEPHQPKDYRLTVLHDAIKHDKDFWYVVVEPSRDDVRSYDYYARLTETEDDIENHEHIKILLMPMLPA